MKFCSQKFVTSQNIRQFAVMANYTPREIIWQGTIEWIHKSKTEDSKISRHLPANIMANIRDGDVEVYVYIAFVF